MDNDSKSLRCVVVDDEPFAIDLLTDYIEKKKSLELVNAFTNPIEALQFLRKEAVDLLFLDVQMPELNGLQFARIIGEECKVIFITAYGEHALESYELNAVDYLLKPISYERFEKAVRKIEGGQSRKYSAKESTPQAAAEYVSKESEIIFVKSGHKTLRILLAEILYLNGSGDYVTLFLKDGSKVLTLEKMSSFEQKLLPPRFCRIHRSHLVAISKIDFIERQRVVIDGKWLPISQTYQKAFWKVVDGKS